MPYFNDVFKALLKEALFTKELLGAGATQIRQADYSRKGIYFHAFTSLSTGLERIGKLCLMLDYYIESKGSFPDLKYLKNEIGHDICLIYLKSKEVARERSVTFHYLRNLDDPIYQSILKVVSAFAKGDRYSNINLLVGATNQSDPITDWYETVDIPIYERSVSEKRKTRIMANAELERVLLGNVSFVLHISETGKEITDIFDGSVWTGMQQAIAPFRQIYVLQIIRFWVELLRDLQYHAQGLGGEDIPYFFEIFAPFYNADSYFKTRKTWDRF